MSINFYFLENKDEGFLKHSVVQMLNRLKNIDLSGENYKRKLFSLINYKLFVII